MKIASTNFGTVTVYWQPDRRYKRVVVGKMRMVFNDPRKRKRKTK